MHFTVTVTKNHSTSTVAHVSSESLPNKGDVLEIVLNGENKGKFKVIDIERKIVIGVGNNCTTFITVNTVNY